MLTDCPDPTEVADFHFLQLRTIRIIKEIENVPSKPLNILASASKYGLLFIGIEGGFKVIKLDDVISLDEDRENKSIEENYPYFFVPSGTPSVLAVNSNQTALAVCIKSALGILINLYSLSAIPGSGAVWQPVCSNTLSSSLVELQDFCWNPAVEGLYAFCLNDGSLHIHEVTGTSIKSIANLQTANAITVCWSPKGKQLVAGKKNGSFSQYKPTLQEVKTVIPPLLEDGPIEVTSICWVSNTVFAVVYVVADTPNLFIVSTPKDSAVVYMNFNDVCLGNNSTSDQKYFLHLEPLWGILICASLDSIEIAVLGDMPNWVQWDLREDGKALLPGKDGATHAVGMTVMYSAQKQIIISESESYPPMPVMFLMTNNGLLVSFHMINTRSEAATLIYPSLPLEMKTTIESGSSAADVVQAFPKSLPQSASPLVTSSFVSEKVPVSNETAVLQKNKSENTGNEILINKPNEVFSSSPNTQEKSFSVSGKQNEVDIQKSSTNDSYMAAIVSEIQSFMKELQDLKHLQNSPSTIDNEDMTSLQVFALNLNNFQNDISQTMQSLSSEIYTLKNVLLESFATVEGAHSRERRKNDHSYLTMLKERALDPVTAKHMQKLNQLYQYMRTQLQEVNDKLDQEWINLKLSDNENSIRKNHYMSSTEAICKTIVNNQKIIHNLKKMLDVLMKAAEKKKLRNTTKSVTWGKYHKRSTQEDLSKLADEFLQTKIACPEEKEPAVTKKLSTESQNFLKAFLKESSVTTVRPTAVYSPSQSRFLSNTVALSETTFTQDQEKDVSSEQALTQPSSMKNDSTAKSSSSQTEIGPNTTFVKKSTADESHLETYAPLYEPVTPPDTGDILQPLSKTFIPCSAMVTPLSKHKYSDAPDVQSYSVAMVENSSAIMQNDSADQIHFSSTSLNLSSTKEPFTVFSTAGMKLPLNQVTQMTCSDSTTVFPSKTQLFTSPVQISSECSISTPCGSTTYSSAQSCEKKDAFLSSSSFLSSPIPEAKKSVVTESSQIFQETPVVPSCVVVSSASLCQDFNQSSAVSSSTSFSFIVPITKQSTSFNAAETLSPLKIPFNHADQPTSLKKNESLLTPKTSSDANINLHNKDSVDSKSFDEQEQGDVMKEPLSHLPTDSFISPNEKMPDIAKSSALTIVTCQANVSNISNSQQTDPPDTFVSKSSTIFSPMTLGSVTQQSVSVTNVVTVSSASSVTSTTTFFPQLTQSISKSSVSSMPTLSPETTSTSTVTLFDQNVTICSPISSENSSKKTESSTTSAFGTKTALFDKSTSPEGLSFFQGTTTTTTTTTVVSSEASPAFVQTTSAQQMTSFGQTSSFPPASDSFFSQTPSFGTPTTAVVAASNSDLNNQATAFSFGKPVFGQTTGSFGLAKSFFGQNTTSVTQSGTSSSFSFSQNSNIIFGQGSFFSGLGGKPSEENASKNVFGISSGEKTADTNNLFRNVTPSFGAVNSGGTFTGTGSFSSGGGSVAQSGFGSFQQSPVQQPATGFGAAPSFGGAPTFGSAPTFGASPTFGAGNSLSSVFGQQQVSSNFSNFANTNSPTFGSLASQASGFNNAPLGGGGFGSPPTFGSLSFGNQSSSFGSPSSTPSNSSAFTQWRN